MNPTHAVISGLGAVSPVGLCAASYIAGLRAGTPGVRLMEPRPTSPTASGGAELETRVVASPWGFDPSGVLSDTDVKRLPRLLPMALAAAREALGGSGLLGLDEAGSRRVGLILGTGGGGIDFTLDQAANVHGGRPPSLWTITNATHGNLAGELSIRLGLRGPSLCVSDGCASSIDALGLALTQLRGQGAGSPDAWVVIGADAHARWETMRGMELLRVINTEAVGCDEEAGRASRPFDRTRAGFVLGEGAWACVVERGAFAEERGAERPVEVLGEVLGYAATCDAYHRVRPDPTMTECVRAMRLGVEDAGLSMEEIGLVQYHGTSTELNDRQETAAVELAFGEHAGRLIGSSIKGAIGHPQGACGLAAVVAMTGALRGLDGGEPFCPPTINLREPDPVCGLDYTPNVARELPRVEGGHTALINCLAFGAKNSAIVLRA